MHGSMNIKFMKFILSDYLCVCCHTIHSVLICFRFLAAVLAMWLERSTECSPRMSA